MNQTSSWIRDSMIGRVGNDNHNRQDGVYEVQVHSKHSQRLCLAQR